MYMYQQHTYCWAFFLSGMDLFLTRLFEAGGHKESLNSVLSFILSLSNLIRWFQKILANQIAYIEIKTETELKLALWPPAWEKSPLEINWCVSWLVQYTFNLMLFQHQNIWKCKGSFTYNTHNCKRSIVH